MTKKEIIELCLKLPNTYEDYPFDLEYTVIRHRDNRKIFCYGIFNERCETRSMHYPKM